MEKFLKILLMIYSIVTSAAVMIYPFLVHGEEDKVEEKNNTTEKEKWEKVFCAVMEGIFIVTVFILFLFILKKKYIWIFVPGTILILLERTNEVYSSLSILKETISSKETENLSKRETDAIIMLAVALMMFNLYNIPQKIIDFVIGLSQEILSDWITIIALVVLVTLYCFLIGVLVLIPIKGIICIIRKIKRKISLETMKKLKNVYMDFKYKLVSREYISINFVAWTLKKKKVMRSLWILLVFFIPIDIIKKIIGFSMNVIMTIGVYVYLIVRRINETILCLINWFEQISDRRVINVIFRSAFVLSVSLVVIVNRYDPFLHKNKASSGVLEFLASAIVIPMILTWIIDYKTSIRHDV